MHVEAKDLFSVSASSEKGQIVRITIATSELDGEVDGYDIFRLNAETGDYDLVGTMDIRGYGYFDFMGEDSWIEYDTTGKIRLYYDIREGHTVGETYYYQVKSFRYSDEAGDIVVNGKVYIDTADASVMILSDGPEFTYGKRYGKLGIQLKWDNIEDADGYEIYYVKNYTDKSKPKAVDIYNCSDYKRIKTIKSKNTTSIKLKKLMNGVTYTYRICSYKIVNGKKEFSSMSEPKSILMDYYSHNGETYEQRIKRAFGSEKKKVKNFKNATKAYKQMKIIKIKVWDFKNGKKGKKVTKTKYLTVNKRLAPSVKAMFDEIYKSKEKQVIKDIGCYSYRTGEHMYGMAIDINPNENYMIDGKKVLAGSYWNPKKSKYSIPLNCETVRIMERYGFYRGFWGDRRDYMHFSYFGT